MNGTVGTAPPEQLSKDHKKLLGPHASALHMIHSWPWHATDAELEAMEDACRSVSQTNCWCFEYEAANLLLPEIRHVQKVRADNAKAEGWSSPQSDTGE